MVNKAIIIGHLGKDPEIKTIQNGNKAAFFNIASSEYWKDKNTGERKSKTEWHRIVVFNEGLINNVIQPHLKKGSKVYVEGGISTREWFDIKTVPNVSIKRHTTEINIKLQGVIIMLDGKDSSSKAVPAPDVADYDLNDEIPF